MNINSSSPNPLPSIHAIRARNDRFRSWLTSGALMLTPAVLALGTGNLARILDAVRDFDDFDDADPTDAHDIGDLEVDLHEPGIAQCRELIFFRIRDLALPGTGTPSLMLIVMLASEW